MSARFHVALISSSFPIKRKMEENMQIWGFKGVKDLTEVCPLSCFYTKIDEKLLLGFR